MSSTLAATGSWVNHGFVIAAGQSAPAAQPSSALVLIVLVIIAFLLLRASLNAAGDWMRGAVEMARVIAGVVKVALLVVGGLVLVIVGVVTSMAH